MRTLIVALFISLASSAHALLPDSGWYWNSAQPGRGFQIEIQNNLLFIAGFAYDASGNQVYIVSGGPMSTDHTYGGEVYTTNGGTCFGCTFKPHTETLFGTLLINFTGPLTATITINGTAYLVERQQFGIDFTSVATPLLGEWMLVDGDTTFPIYSGERIRLFKISTDAQGPYASGNRAGETGADNVAIGYRSSTGTWVMLLDSSTSYYRLYNFKFAGLNRIEGTFFIYQKTSSPGSGSPFIGERIKSAAAAAGQNAPGTGKNFPVLDLDQFRANQDAARHALNESLPLPASDEDRALAARLANHLRQRAQ